ncbi:uncharacterized protein ACRADG_001263 isoform 2-T3 [Cochliomyia hominivorax]
MSEQKSRNNGKLLTITDLKNAAIEIENNLEFVNKTLINKILKALSAIMIMVQRKEPGLFKEIVKWFGLYLQVLLSINPDDKILLKYYEKTVPTVISYIIGCLQYNTKELNNYHLNLLEILEEILDNVQTKVLKEIKQFKTGTIGCLWNPIDVAGDFNTQVKALKILSILLKQFDETRQNEELKCIKWTNLNLFQDKLKIIVQETKLQHVMENNSRDLLNNYNMNLSKNILVYSFFCLSVNLAKKYKFYKPLNHDKFWIDINYRPQTLSYKGRFKMYSKSKYEDINVVLKIQMMKLENNNLIIYFETPGEFSKYTQYFSNISNNVIQFNLTTDERQRLNANDYIMKYFNNLNKISIRNLKKYSEEETNTLELLKSEMTTNLKDEITNKTNSKSNSNSYQKCLSFLKDCTPEENVYDEKSSISSKSLQYNKKEAAFNESPKLSRKTENDTLKRSTRKLRNRNKFFTSLLEENSEDGINKKKFKKRSQSKKSRQNKSRYKQVCKVTPTVDLTKMENIKPNVEISLDIDKSEDVITKPSSTFISSQDCAKVLKQVAEIYNNDDAYAKPCQSYRNFKIESTPLADISNTKNTSRTTRRKTKTNNIKNESTTQKKLKLMDGEENKENINPLNKIQSKNIKDKHKRIISPHLFETQRSNATPPRNLLQKPIEKDKNIEIDLTLDKIPTKNNCNKQNQENTNNEHLLSSSSDCEEVRGLNENVLKDVQHICSPTKSILNCSSNVSTPRAPNIMNVSELSDSDMEITQIVNKNFLMQKQSEEMSKNINMPDNLNMELTLVENKESETNPNSQNGFEMLRQQEEIKNILNDFDYSSDEFNCNIRTPIKKTSLDSITTQNLNNNLIGRNYQRDCVVFQKRFDSDSSDEDFEITRDPSTNLNFVTRENLSLDLNETCSTPEIVTTMATKCEVTPNAIIVHQIQVSAKKSVLCRRNHSKVNKCLNNYYKSSSNKLKEIHKEAITLGKENQITLKEKSSDTNSLALDKYIKTYKKISKNSLVEDYKLTKFPIALHHHLKEMKYLKPKNIENDTFESNGGNLFDKPSVNGIADELFEDLPENLEYSYSNMSSRNLNSHLNRDDLKNTYNTLKSDLLRIFNNYNTNMQQRLNNAHERIELQQICFNIGRLVRELQQQCDEFSNKHKQFDVHKEITENVLKIISNMDSPNSITHDYEELVKEIRNEQQEILEKNLQKYLEKRSK